MSDWDKEEKYRAVSGALTVLIGIGNMALLLLAALTRA